MAHARKKPAATKTEESPAPEDTIAPPSHRRDRYAHRRRPSAPTRFDASQNPPVLGSHRRITSPIRLTKSPSP